MTGLQTYRVSAYNTSRQSENKIHDDTVARRFGFKGGLVPGVDVMAYMMHLPVEKWGRAFLERGLIDARFVKPVYDGEIAEVTGEESNGVLSIEVNSRGQLCASAACIFACGFTRGFHRSRCGDGAQAGQCNLL
jgi:acyl dehydratase